MTRSTLYSIAIAIHALFLADLTSAQSFFRVTDPQNEAAVGMGHVNYNGAAWVDYDNDGDEDLFACRNRMYRNDGGGIFVSVNLGIMNTAGLGNGCSWADYDNDGDLDVAIGSNPNSTVYRNDGNDIFTALDEGDIDWHLDHRAFACAWGDYDSDSNMDLIVIHPGGFMGSPFLNNMVFHNDGPPNYLFTRDYENDVVEGLAAFTVGTFYDFDLDGDQDFFIGSGPVAQPGVDYLYQNQLVETGYPYLERITEGIIATTERDGQNFNWIDYDNDTDLDCYITNYQGGVLSGMANDLYRNDGEAGFTEITTGTIVTDAQVSLGNSWGDFDNDGDLDCVVANESATNKYYRNNGDGTFASIGNPVTYAGLCRCPVSCDYDDDGDLDLFISGVNTAQRFFENQLENDNHYLKVKCVGVMSNKAAIGTRVRAKASINGVSQWQQREINSQNSFNGHNSFIVHFGLGDAEVVDSLEIYWPYGTVQSFANVSADQYLIIPEDSVASSTPNLPVSIPNEFALSAYPNPFNGNVQLSYSISSGSARIHIYNLLGQSVFESDLLTDSHGSFNWNAAGLTSSSYFAILRSESGESSEPITLRYIR